MREARYPRSHSKRRVRVRGPRQEVREGANIRRQQLYILAPNKALQVSTANALAGDGAYTPPNEAGEDAE